MTAEDDFLETAEGVFREFQAADQPTWRRRQELRDELLRSVHKYIDAQVIKHANG